MAFVFEICAEFGNDKSALDEFADRFCSQKIVIGGFKPFGIWYSQSALNTTGFWTWSAVLGGMSIFSCEEDVIHNKESESRYIAEILKRLKDVSTYRAAVLGWECSGTLTHSPLNESVKEAYPGFIIDEATMLNCADFGKRNNYEPFSPGFQWVPYRSALFREDENS